MLPTMPSWGVSKGIEEGARLLEQALTPVQQRPVTLILEFDSSLDSRDDEGEEEDEEEDLAPDYPQEDSDLGVDLDAYKLCCP